MVKQPLNSRDRYDSKFFPTDLKELPNDNFLALSDLNLHEKFDGIAPGVTLTELVRISESQSSVADACRAALEFTKRVFVALMHEDGRHINREVVPSMNPKIPHVVPFQRVKEVEDNWNKFATYTVWMKLRPGPRDNAYWIEQRANCLERKAKLEWLNAVMDGIEIDQIRRRYMAKGPSKADKVSRLKDRLSGEKIRIATYNELRNEVAPILGVSVVKGGGKKGVKGVADLRSDCIKAYNDILRESTVPMESEPEQGPDNEPDEGDIEHDSEGSESQGEEVTNV